MKNLLTVLVLILSDFYAWAIYQSDPLYRITDNSGSIVDLERGNYAPYYHLSFDLKNGVHVLIPAEEIKIVESISTSEIKVFLTSGKSVIGVKQSIFPKEITGVCDLGNYTITWNKIRKFEFLKTKLSSDIKNLDGPGANVKLKTGEIISLPIAAMITKYVGISKWPIYKKYIEHDLNAYVHIRPAVNISYQIPLSWIKTLSFEENNSKSVIVILNDHALDGLSTVKGTIGDATDNERHAYFAVAGEVEYGYLTIPYYLIKSIEFLNQNLEYSSDWRHKIQEGDDDDNNLIQKMWWPDSNDNFTITLGTGKVIKLKGNINGRVTINVGEGKSELNFDKVISADFTQSENTNTEIERNATIKLTSGRIVQAKCIITRCDGISSDGFFTEVMNNSIKNVSIQSY